MHESVDNVKIHEPLGNSDHNQIHFDIKAKSESNVVQIKNTGETATKVNIKIWENAYVQANYVDGL